MKKNEVPTLVCNKFYVTVGTESGRLVLGEEVTKDDPTNYHIAAAMTRADLKGLADLINRLLAETEGTGKNEVP